MVKQKQKIKKTNRLYFLTLILFFPIFFILEFTSLFMPVVSGFATFPLKIIECGHQPYIANNFAGLHSYTKPGDALYHGPNALTQSEDYYCDESEAQKAGNEPYVWAERCQSAREVQPVGCTSNGDGSLDAILPFFTTLAIISGVISYVISLKIIKQKMKSKKGK